MRILRFIGAVAVASLSVIASGAEVAKVTTGPATRPFVISKETTFATGPVRNDGTIDYVAAINEHLSKGVTKENNAAIPLLEAVTMGGADRPEHYAKLRQCLGVAEPAAGANAGALQEPAGDVVDQAGKGPWTAAKNPEAARWLDSMGGRLDLAVEASKRDHYYMPLVREHEDDALAMVLLPHLSPERQLCRALKARAMLCLGNEDIDGFGRDAIAIVRIGRLTTHAPTIIENLVGTGCEAVGLDAIKIASSGAWLSEAQANKLLADLRAAPARRPIYDTLEGGERGFFLEFLQAAAVHGTAKVQQIAQNLGMANKTAFPALNTTKDWNLSLRKANAWYDRLAEAGKLPTYPERMKAANGVMADVKALKEKYDGWKSIFAPMEDQLVGQLMPSMERAYTTEARIAANMELTQTSLALLAFRTKLGEYPPNLRLLVPAYFKAEPLDEFTNKPLIYTVNGAGYELKSAGPGTQLGGAVQEDLVIRAAN
jgi:hypothetical protein